MVRSLPRQSPLLLSRTNWKPLLLLMLVVAGLLLALYQPANLPVLFEMLKSQRGHTGFVLILLLLQTVLYMLALPGSWVLWLTAPLYTPLPATLILVCGTTTGALAGYGLSLYLGQPWQGRLRQNRTFQVLERRGDFMTLLALRMTPSFPHSVINYSAGILRLPLFQFTLATFLGLIPKTYLYCYSIDKAMSPQGIVGKNEWYLLILLAVIALGFLGLRLRWILKQSHSSLPHSD